MCVRGRASKSGLRDGLGGDGADEDRARAMANRGPNRWTGQGTGDDVSNIEHLAGDDSE